jgi:predicted RecB family nuclease
MISATAIASFLACHHLTTLDRAESAGKINKPFLPDASMELLKKLGLQHEQSYLHNLEENIEVMRIPCDIPWSEAVAQTIEALQNGAGAIYQATFQNNLWGGRADFLLRVDRPSSLGPWSYEVVETKLMRSAKARALIQLCFYSDLLSGIQGREPQSMHLVLGGNSLPEKFYVQHFIAYFRKVRGELDEAWSVGADTYPEPNEHCRICDWSTVCLELWRSDDYLSLVAGISRSQRKLLAERNIKTLAALASVELPIRPKLDGIGAPALFRIHEQARIQFAGREQGRNIYDLLEPIELEKGFAALPAPSFGDVFLDLEGDPYASETGLEYLFGFLTESKNPGADPTYDAFWSLTPAKEKEAFRKVIAIIMERLERYPDMHIYHYAPYEPTHFKSLAGRHGVCVDEMDRLLRGGTFVDLFRVVRQGLRASVEGYSIKKLEPLYRFNRTVELRSAVLARQTLESLLAFGNSDAATSDVISCVEQYNRDDCLSALHLRNWLEERREELEIKIGKPIPRPAPKSGDPGEELADRIEEVTIVIQQLVSGLPADETEWTNEQRASWLLAQMLEWHRREDKSAWWEYYRLRDLSSDELIEDKTALGGLSYVGEVGRIKRSKIHQYSFPPQDHAIEHGKDLRDPKTGQSAGTFVALDEEARTINIKRGDGSSVPHPEALIPHKIMGTKELRASLLALGAWVADHCIVGPGPFQAARDLLLRQSPQALNGMNETLANEKGEITKGAEELLRVLSATPSILPIQGPPGSGKTYIGARMILELIRQGRKVGITACSHKVISNLLNEICKAAREARMSFRIAQKANDDDGCSDAMVMQLDDNKEVYQALRTPDALVVAGTAWLWARQDIANSIDVLFVDEAGQMSLANVLAISRAATSVVLLGDPQQLEQPQKGVHPPGADISALAHLLHGKATIVIGDGIFLSETWRLHPDICAFTSEVFYDGRLEPRPENQNQRLNTCGFLDGTGLRFIPIAHQGNRNGSPEEVERVAEIVNELLANGTTWTTKHGEKQLLTLEDVLVVAPYNVQVSALRNALPGGARVGTVDKFQGQEAPVVIYSMTTSSPEDAPRGMEFLYSGNRLNVAVSRARCLAVIVASPALFTVQCKTGRQIELANAFCRYLELARKNYERRTIHSFN